MEEYVLNYESYEKRDAVHRSTHKSWCELCEKQTKDKVINILKKHLYEPGEYTLDFYTYDGFIRKKSHQNFFQGWLTRKDENAMGGKVLIGGVSFDYFDDTFEKYDFVNEWPKIDCKKELMNPNPRFIVVHDGLFPSPKEFEIMSQKSAERFIKRLHKAVDFPLEIACDYPDVIFEICYDRKPDEGLTLDTLKFFEEYAAKYNKRHEDGIHYIADVTDTVDDRRADSVCVHVDFGECGIEVLASFIKAVGKSSLPIKEMTLK